MDDLSSELQKLKIDQSKRHSRREGPSKSWILFLVVIFALVLVGVFIFSGPADALTVRTVRPDLGDREAPVLVATGYVVAHHKIDLSSKVIGRVEWIGVEKGDRVRKGQLLVKLEDREYRAQVDRALAVHEGASARLAELESGSRPEEIQRARAEMDRAEAQLRTDEANLDRVEGLVTEGIFTARDLDEALGRRDVSRANLEALALALDLVRLGPRIEQINAARAEVARARADLDYSETLLDAVEIRAPIDGVILERIVEPGEMVTTSFVGERGAKSSTVSLADLNDLQVELDISQNDFNRIHADQECRAVTDAYPDRVYDCVVAEIAPEADRQRATIQVKVQILAPDTLIKPEMNARVTFLDADVETTADSGEQLSIPSNSIVDRGSGTAVLVLVNGEVQVRPITIDREVGVVSFVSAGLTGTESIIVGEELTTLQPGDRVERRNE